MVILNKLPGKPHLEKLVPPERFQKKSPVITKNLGDNDYDSVEIPRFDFHLHAIDPRI